MTVCTRVTWRRTIQAWEVNKEGIRPFVPLVTPTRHSRRLESNSGGVWSIRLASLTHRQQNVRQPSLNQIHVFSRMKKGYDYQRISHRMRWWHREKLADSGAGWHLAVDHIVKCINFLCTLFMSFYILLYFSFMTLVDLIVTVMENTPLFCISIVVLSLINGMQRAYTPHFKSKKD